MATARRARRLPELGAPLTDFVRERTRIAGGRPLPILFAAAGRDARARAGMGIRASDNHFRPLSVTDC